DSRRLNACITLIPTSLPRFLFPPPPPPPLYTLPLHDALPISRSLSTVTAGSKPAPGNLQFRGNAAKMPSLPRHYSCSPSSTHFRDRKSTRLNSSHEWISYAVFCLKKKRILTVGLVAVKRA